MTNIVPEDASSLMKTSPSLVFKKYLPSTNIISMRQDKKALAISNKSVRQALIMAIDYKTMKDTLYRGDAEILSFPWWNIKAFNGVYTPLDQLPSNLQDLYSGNVTKAKQLLSDAGYPNGFKTKVVCQTISDDVDFLSLVKNYWAKINVDLTIQPVDPGVYSAMKTIGSEEEMIYGTSAPAASLETNISVVFRSDTGSATPWNSSWVIGDPTIEKAYADLNKVAFIDVNAEKQILKGITPYLLESVFYIPRPGVYNYVFWAPWIQNYHGELSVSQATSDVSWLPFVWMDTDMKARMSK